MNRTLGLLLLGLVGCVPTQTQQPPFQVDEVQLLFPDATERWTYFYGAAQSVKLDSQTLTLAQGTTSALSVDGQPWRRGVSAAIPPLVQTTRNFLGLQALVQPSTKVRGAWLYDSRWFSLSGIGSVGTPQTLTQAPGTPSFQALTQDETNSVLREILSRAAGRPTVLYEVNPPLPALALDPPPNRYNLTALAVQYGLGVEALMQTSAQPRVLAQGANAAYTDPSPTAYIVADASTLAALWRTANGNQLTPSAAPAVNFGASRVVAFFWGQKNTGGYNLQFVGSALSGSTLQVRLRLSMPAPGSMTTQSLTSPFVVLEVPAIFSRVEFVDDAGQLLASAGK